jgi:hypothetical protein
MIRVLILLAVAAAMGCAPSKPKDWRQDDETAGAWVRAKAIVESQLKAPGSAEFPGVREWPEQVTRNRQTYTINSWVDAQNDFGAKLRKRFTIVLKETSQDTWECESFSFID